MGPRISARTFPANLAHRLVHFIHRHFLVPSCKVDLTRFHPKPCLQYHIHRCLGPCVEGLTTDDAYSRAVRNVRLFLEGRHGDLARDLRARMEAASTEMRFEEAASLRDLLATVEEMEERQKMAAAKGDDVDIFACYAEPPLVALNLFHLRNGQIVDRREFFWEDQPEFDEPQFFSSLLKQLYLDQQYIPAEIHVPVEFEDREALEELLSEKRNRRVEIRTPQRGQKKALLDLVGTNAKHSFDARFRVLKPSSRAIQEALQDGLNLPSAPARIECFDISHIQGTDKVASMVVWEDGRMKKADYRKFIIRTVIGNDDFASMREVVTRRYSRLQEEKRAMPGLVLIDGGLGQLHAAADALEAHRDDQPAAGVDRQARGDHLRLRPGRRAGGARPVLAHPAPGAIDPRRGPPVRRDLPPVAPQCAPAHLGAGHDCRRGEEDRAEAAEGVRELGAGAGGERRATDGGGGPRGGAQSPGALSVKRYAFSMRMLIALPLLVAAAYAQQSRHEIVTSVTPADSKPNNPEVPEVAAISTRFERVLVLRFKYDTEMLSGLERALKEQKVRNAVILSGFGSVRNYQVHQVSNRTLPSKNMFVKDPTAPADITAMSGFVMGGRVHAHITLANPEGAFAGHLEPGTNVFTFAVVTLGVLPDSLDVGRLDDKNWR